MLKGAADEVLEVLKNDELQVGLGLTVGCLAADGYISTANWFCKRASSIIAAENNKHVKEVGQKCSACRDAVAAATRGFGSATLLAARYGCGG